MQSSLAKIILTTSSQSISLIREISLNISKGNPCSYILLHVFIANIISLLSISNLTL